MKKTIIAFAVTALLAACSSSDSGTSQVASVDDQNNDDPVVANPEDLPAVSFADDMQPLEVPRDIGQITITVETDVPVDVAASVDLTYAGTAERGVDYTAPDSVAFSAGQSSITFSVNIDSAEIGFGENIIITMADPDELVLAGSNTQFVIVTEQLSDLPQVSFVPDEGGDPLFVSEDVGSVDIVVEASAGFQVEGSVQLNYSGIATRGDDFTGPDTLTFQPGENQAVLTIEILKDDIPEGGENIVITMTEPDDVSLGENTEFIIVISGQIILPDTGVVSYYNAGDFTAATAGANYPDQDADFGHDTFNGNQTFDGHASFSFTKLDFHGNQMPENATEYHCIRDNNTGLVWERKTAAQNIDMPELPTDQSELLQSEINMILAHFSITRVQWDALSAEEQQAIYDKFLAGFEMPEWPLSYQDIDAWQLEIVLDALGLTQGDWDGANATQRQAWYNEYLDNYSPEEFPTTVGALTADQLQAVQDYHDLTPAQWDDLTDAQQQRRLDQYIASLENFLPESAADLTDAQIDLVLSESSINQAQWEELSDAERQQLLDDYIDSFAEQIALWTENWQAVDYRYLWWLDNEERHGGIIGAIGGEFRDPEKPVKPMCAFPTSDTTGYVAPEDYGCSVKTYLEVKNNLGYCGYSDWRMPEINELQSLVIYQVGESVFDEDYFPESASGVYLSGTTVADNRDSAWCVKETTAETLLCSKHMHYNLRAVRSSAEW